MSYPESRTITPERIGEYLKFSIEPPMPEKALQPCMKSVTEFLNDPSSLVSINRGSVLTKGFIGNNSINNLANLIGTAIQRQLPLGNQTKVTAIPFKEAA